MNLIDKAVSVFSPQKGFERAKYRRAMAAYEAAKPSRIRKNQSDNSSGTTVVAQSGDALRGTARSLEQNYDVVKTALDLLVNNTVGPNGITKEPRPKDINGEIHAEFAGQLLDVWEDFKLNPEVTGEHDYASMERLLARTLFRDGEELAQLVVGTGRGLNHRTRVPFSIEMVEIDQLPFTMTDQSRGIINGVELNGWGRPLAYHMYKSHPGNSTWEFSSQTKRVPASRMLHPKLTQRIGQVRGVTVFHSVLNRIDDLKEYEESERVAARVAASLTGYVKKGVADDYVAPESGDTERHFSMAPGLIADNLEVGEEIGLIESNRPSALLTPFHAQMLRSTAGGVGVGYSSLSRNYDGTYSAQRQELVEGWIHYQALTSMIAGQISRPIWKTFVDMAILSGVVQVPSDLDMNTLYDADYRGPPMPWIDPVKEVTANIMAEKALHKTGPQIIRERNGNPSDLLKEEALWRTRMDEAGVISSATVVEVETDEPETRSE